MRHHTRRLWPAVGAAALLLGAAAPAYAANALIDFAQGASNPAAGIALIGSTGTLVSVANGGDNTGTLSWEVDIVYKPVGSLLSTGAVASSNSGGIPSASFTPDVTGCYRIELQLWTVTNRSGTAADADIRNFCVPEAGGSGFVVTPYQGNPSRIAGKPDEMNFGGQTFGWAGTGTTTDGGLIYQMRTTAAQLPSATQKLALAGTTGTPGAGNKYVTDTDSRLAPFDATHAGLVPASGGSSTTCLRGDGSWSTCATGGSGGSGGGGDMVSTNNLSDVASKIAAHDNIIKAGADIASASTTDLSTATGDYVNVTGSATIASLGTLAVGVWRTVRFTGTATLTYNATSLILPGAASITAQAGDIATFRSLGSGNWACGAYMRLVSAPPTQANTGTGGYVLHISPTLVTPTLGVATGTSFNKLTITPPSTSATLTIANGATLTASATATVSGTNTGDQSPGTGSGALVGASSPTLSGATLNGTTTYGGAVDMGAHAIKGLTQEGYGSSIHDNGTKTGASQVLADFSSATGYRYQRITLGGTVSSSSWTGPDQVGTSLLQTCQDFTGSRVVSAWPTSPAVSWLGTAGSTTPPSLTTTALACDFLVFYWDGTTLWGQLTNSAAGGGLSAPVANSSLATMSTSTVKANISGSTAAPSDVATSSLLDASTVMQSAISSASTTSIASFAGRTVHITGTVTITSFGNCTAGWERKVIFDGGPITLTHNSTSLKIGTGANRIARAGDRGIFHCDSTNNWYEDDWTYAGPDPIGLWDLGNSSTAISTVSHHLKQKTTVTANTTITLTHVAPAADRETSIVVHACENGTGAFTIAFTAASGALIYDSRTGTPAFNTAANKCNTLSCIDDGTNFRCSAHVD